MEKVSKTQIIGIIVGLVVATTTYILVQKYVFPKPTIDSSLMEMASEMNKNLPMMVDAETRVDNMTALPNKTVLYNYTLVNYENGMLDTTVVKNNLEPGMINVIKTNPDMRFFREKEVTMKYYYKDKNGNYMFSITIGPEEYK